MTSGLSLLPMSVCNIENLGVAWERAYSSSVHQLYMPALQYCYFSKSHLLEGVGTLSFYMVNMRGVFQFGFFRGGI